MLLWRTDYILVAIGTFLSEYVSKICSNWGHLGVYLCLSASSDMFQSFKAV